MILPMLSRRVVAAIVLSLAVLVAALPSSAPATERITSGTKVEDAQYQSHYRGLVALVYADATNQYDGQFCAGTLIDELHVLTAGHCIVEDGDLRTRMAPSAMLVLAGTPNLNEDAMDRANLVPVSTIFVNQFFNIRTMRYDAAVLRLSRPITTVPVMPRLTDADVAALGMGTTQVEGLVAGWGDTNPNSDDCCFPTELKGVGVPIHANDTCVANLANADDLSFSPEFQFCAGRLGTGGRLGADTCQGDSGGPLVIDIAGAPRHAGVTSFGFGCGQKFFGVYARTTALGPWLDSIPGIPDGDTRDLTHGPGDLAAPTVAGRPNDFKSVHLTITPATSGGAATSYTVWAREGRANAAEDIFLGTQTSTSFVLKAPPTNTTANYTLLVRPSGEHGEGPAARVLTRPVVDRFRPSVPGAVRIARSGSFVTVTWRASIDRQSGMYGYYVQRKVGGTWRTPVLTRVARLRFNAGRSHGSVRVLSEDWADNRSAWSGSVAY